MQQGKVFRNKIFVGILKKTSQKEYIFKYDESYLSNEKSKAIAFSFPLQKEEFKEDHLFAFFFNMLSEGSQKKLQVKKLKLDENDDFSRLLITAQTDTIGSVTLMEIRDE